MHFKNFKIFNNLGPINSFLQKIHFGANLYSTISVLFLCFMDGNFEKEERWKEGFPPDTTRQVTGDRKKHDDLFHSEGHYNYHQFHHSHYYNSHYQNLKKSKGNGLTMKREKILGIGIGEGNSSIQRKLAPKPEIYFESPFNLIQPISNEQKRERREENIYINDRNDNFNHSGNEINDKRRSNIKRQSILDNGGDNDDNKNRNNAIISPPSLFGSNIKRKKYANNSFKSALNRHSSSNRIYTFSILNHIVEQFNSNNAIKGGNGNNFSIATDKNKRGNNNSNNINDETSLPFKKSQKFRMRSTKKNEIGSGSNIKGTRNNNINRMNLTIHHSTDENNNFRYVFNNYI